MTWLVLAATAFSLLLAVMPALLRAAGLGPLAAGGSMGFPSRRPSPAFHPVPGDKGGEGPMELPLDEEDEDEPSEPKRPRMSSPSGAEPSEPSGQEGKASMRPAVARKKAKLHLSSAADTQAVGEVEAGETVFVMREKGEWALVFHTSDDGVVMGWMEKSLLSMR